MRAALAALGLAAAAAAAATGSTTYVEVAVDDGKDGPVCRRTQGDGEDVLARAWFTDDVETDGWGKLWVQAKPGIADTERSAFAAGCAQGIATQHRMYQFWQNYMANEYGAAGKPCARLEAFMEAQMNYTRIVVRDGAEWADKALLDAIRHVSAQFEGVAKGYAAAAPAGEEMSTLAVYLLNAIGDLEDLDGLCRSLELSPEAIAAVEELTGRPYPPAAPAVADPVPQALKLTDCSGFLRVLDDGSDLVFGQATWRRYYAMLRTYNVYDLPYAPGRVLSFSSSPGLLSSKDDYALSGGEQGRLLIFETTNSVYNGSLYTQHLTPRSLLTWQRSAVGMQWATSGEAYSRAMRANQSGTYNNQWVVVDAKRFSGKPEKLQDGLLWVTELIPGASEAADMTSVLQSQSYWPSYNIPYFPSIYNASGYPAKAASMGDDFVYSKAPRANIFRRNASAVTDLEALGRLMRYNDYQHDPLAKGDPILGAIASRGDLAAKPTPFGAVDAKVTAWSRVRDGVPRSAAICGPTHEQQAVFAWQPLFPDVVRQGVPDAFPFEWADMRVEPPQTGAPRW